MTVRWTFEDPVTSTSYTFAMNPSEGGSPTYKKNVTQTATAAADGNLILFEGRDQAATFDFSGTILTPEHYNALLSWWKRRRQIRVTDDLGRQTWIYLTEFEPKRQRSAVYPYKHTYNCKAMVVADGDTRLLARPQTPPGYGDYSGGYGGDPTGPTPGSGFVDTFSDTFAGSP